MLELKDEQSGRRQEETTYSRTNSSSAENGSLSDVLTEPANPNLTQLNTLGLGKVITFSGNFHRLLD